MAKVLQFHSTLSFLLALVFVQVLYGNKQSLADLELAKIVEMQDVFFAQGKNWSEAELTRQAQVIVNRYESHITENPKDFDALVLFGKFLRKNGQANLAMGYFLEADRLNPNVAVIKQQIGNFLTEQGKPLDAFPFFLMTVRLSPREPIYHYNLGDFIFLFEKQLTAIEKSSESDLCNLMHESFREAARLAPHNFDFQLRFAQSFFDLENPDLKHALNAWIALHEGFGHRSEKEIDYINLCKSRILLEMERYEEAISLISRVRTTSLDKEKKALWDKARDRANQTKKSSESSPERSIRKSSESPIKSSKVKSFVFPADPHLLRMKSITQSLQQENWLKDFKQDVVLARVLSNGEFSLELSAAERKKGLEK